MSQGNDAFSSKDADSNTDPSTAGTAAQREPSEREASGSESSKAASEAASASSKPEAKAKSSNEGSRDDGSDDVDSEADSDQKGARPKPNDARDKEPARGRRRGGSRRSSRDDEDEDDREPPQTEEALDVPKMQTVYMLGAISILTIILWFAAKLSCNVHPDQMRDPKHFSTRELAADPKNAAFEFHHRFETGDFTTALDLSTGEVKNLVESKLLGCEQDPDTCAKNMAQLEGTIQSTAKVLDRSTDRANVELISESKAWPGRKSFLFEVVKQGEYWLVASRREAASGAAAEPAQVDAPVVEATPEESTAGTAPAAATAATP
jgi:hypothetical protein